MSLIAPVEDGQLVTSTSGTTTQASSSTDSMDKEAFLQLLVAQMKYQDPLEPTSNTEYISQYAQFSQVESLQNMSSSMDLQRASGLVGQTVYVKATATSGETSYIYGKVDYVTYEGGKAYVYINENRYALSDVETVLDSAYDEAYQMATKLVEGINKLPNIGAIDLSSAETVDELAEAYADMNEYQKTFVATEKAEALQAYADKIAELRKQAEAANKAEENEENADNTENTDNADESGNVDGSEGAGEV